MITHIVTHWVKPDQVERALELFEHNGRVIKSVSGLVHRQILRSTTEPLRFTAINTWENEEAFQRWMEHPDHMLDSYGTTLSGPAGSDYFEKYKDAGDFDSRPAESDRYEVIPNP